MVRRDIKEIEVKMMDLKTSDSISGLLFLFELTSISISFLFIYFISSIIRGNAL